MRGIIIGTNCQPGYDAPGRILIIRLSKRTVFAGCCRPDFLGVENHSPDPDKMQSFQDEF